MGTNGAGLYVGCGNGRNYLPLVGSCADLYGLDISPKAIKHLIEQKPELRQRLICSDFLQFEPERAFDYWSQWEVIWQKK